MLGGLVEGLEGRSEVCRSDLRRGGADLKPRRLIRDLEGRCKIWRADMRSGGSTQSLEGKLEA